MNFSWPQFEVSRLGVNRKFGWNLARRRKNGRFGFSDLVLISNSFDVWQARSIFSGRILRFQGWVSIASSAGTSPGGEKTAGLHLPPGGFEVLLVAMNLKMFAGLGLCGLIASGTRAQPAAPAVTNLWKVRLPDSGNESSPALAPDGTIYQGTFGGWLVAIMPDGKVKWKFKTGREVRSSPAVADDGTIYFGSRDWKFYALTPAGKLKWTFPTGAWVDSSPALAPDGTVYFGSWDKNFYALAPDGKLKWKFATSNLIVSSPAVALDGTVYFGSHDKNFYALAPDGKLKWKFATGAELESSPAGA